MASHQEAYQLRELASGYSNDFTLEKEHIGATTAICGIFIMIFQTDSLIQPHEGG